MPKALPADFALAGAGEALEPPAAPPSIPYPPLTQSYWALGIFSLAMVVNFLDRGIINLLVTPIKRDLHLTDVQISLLMGFAFVIFYIVLGFPIASLVDSKKRRTILGLGLFCWSGMTALCGIAQNFWSFFFCRVGVGVGESCTGPSMLSMISDLFPPERITRAIAIMSFGSVIGMGLSQMIGASVIQALQGQPDLHVPVLGTIRNWQMVFFLVGAPGLIVACLMFTIVEPRRRGSLQQTAAAAHVSWWAVLRFVRQNGRCYGPILFAVAMSSMVTTGTVSWAVTFYERTYHWSPVHSGYLLGMMTLVTMPTGLWLGSWLSEWCSARGYDDANMRVASWASLLAIPWLVLSPLMPTPWLAMVMYGIGQVLALTAGVPMNAALQVITPNEMRGRISSLYLLLVNVLGMGIGPTLIAVLTDGVFHDEAKLRYSMALAAALVSWIPAVFYWYARGPYGEAVIKARGRR